MDKKKSEELKELAIAIKARLNIEIRHNKKTILPPLIIEIAGPPSSGKSTIIGKLDTSMRRLGFKVGLVQEGAQKVRNIERSEPDYNRATALYSLHKLYEMRAIPSLDIIIFERCIFDALVWPEYWLAKGKLSPEEVMIIKDFYLFDAGKVDVAFFIVRDPDLSVKGESKILSVDQEKGGTTNVSTITVLKQLYELIYEELREEKNISHIHLLDTSNLTEQEMVDKVTEITLIKLSKKCENSS